MIGTVNYELEIKRSFAINIKPRLTTKILVNKKLHAIKIIKPKNLLFVGRLVK